MKKKTKTIIAIIGIAALLISGLATGVGVWSSQSSISKNKNDSLVVFNEEDQNDFIETLKEMTESGYRPLEIEKKLEGKLDQLSKENATRAVREFMKSIEYLNDYYASFLSVMAQEINYSQIVDQAENPVQDLETLSNEFAKGYLKELKRQHISIKPTKNFFYMEPDANYVLETYGTYVHGDYKDYLNLLANQQKYPIFDEENQVYRLNRVLDDLVAIENSRDRWTGGEYEADFQDIEEYLYRIAFSLSQGTFFDDEVINEGKENEDILYTLKEDIVKEYETFMVEHPDEPLTKEIERYLAVMKKNNYQLTKDVDSFVGKWMEEKFSKEGSTDESNSLDEAGESDNKSK